jgi:hypothetical protein
MLAINHSSPRPSTSIRYRGFPGRTQRANEGQNQQTPDRVIMSATEWEIQPAANAMK